MAFVLGPLLEESLRRAMLLSEGSPSVFVTRAISLALILWAAGLLALVLVPRLRQGVRMGTAD